MPDASIVTTANRYKPPPKKRKAGALDVPTVVITRSVGNRQTSPPVDDEPTPAAPFPANDDSPTQPAPPAAKSAIVTTTNRKRTRFLSAEQRAAEPEPDDPEADAAMRAWLERAKWGHGTRARSVGKVIAGRQSARTRSAAV
jgi:hypothetical protein